jgi:Holliday junction resolvasome RuvABC endonuclease subunit
LFSHGAWIKVTQVDELARGMWQAPEAVKGHEATLSIAALEYEYFRSIIGKWGPNRVVHEMPPVGGAMARPESSLVAATALRCAAAYFDTPVSMIGAQKAKKRWTGNGNAKKPEVKKALEAWRPQLRVEKPWNHDLADALALGLTWAETRGE